MEPGQDGKWFKVLSPILKGTLIENGDITINVSNSSQNYTWTKEEKGKKAGGVDLAVILKEGSNTVNFTVKDSAGNTFKTGDITLKVDTVIPNIIAFNKVKATDNSGKSKEWTWIPPAGSGPIISSEQKVSLYGVFDDQLSGVAAIEINGQTATIDTNAKTFSFSDYYLQSGTNILKVVAKDKAGM